MRRAALLIDALIGLGVFAIVVTGIIFALMVSQSGVIRSSDHIAASYLNQKALSAVRVMRDTDFDAIEEGTYGIWLEDGIWAFTGSSVTNSNGFTTSVIVAEIDENTFSLEATTAWQFGAHSSGSTTLVSQMTNWRTEQSIGDWTSVSLDGAYIDDDTPLFNDAVTTDSYAFVTSETSDGGDGLYVFDISDTQNPVRVADAFSLGFAGHGILIYGTNLFVVTEDPSQEVRVYDISDPENFDATDLQNSINVPAAGKVRDIAYYNGVLFVVSQEDSSEAELYSYDVADIESIALLDTIDDVGASYTGIQLYNGYAYLSSTSDTMELRVIDIFDPENMSVATGEGYNITDTVDATSVIAFGDTVIVGRNQSAVSEELHLFSVSESPVPSSANNAEAGNTVHSLSVEPTGDYAFAATEHATQELVVLDIDTFKSGVGSPITETYDTSTGFGRGVYYDVLIDRVLLMTNTAVLLLRPA